MVTRQVRAEAADPLVHCNHIAGEVPDVRVVGVLVGLVISSTVAAVVTQTVSADVPAAIEIIRNTATRRTGTEANTASAAHLDCEFGLDQAKASDRHSVGRHYAENAESKDQRKMPFHLLVLSMLCVGSAGHAGTIVSLKLTFHPDHSIWAAHPL